MRVLQENCCAVDVNKKITRSKAMPAELVWYQEGEIPGGKATDRRGQRISLAKLGYSFSFWIILGSNCLTWLSPVTEYEDVMRGFTEVILLVLYLSQVV